MSELDSSRRLDSPYDADRDWQNTVWIAEDDPADDRYGIARDLSAATVTVVIRNMVTGENIRTLTVGDGIIIGGSESAKHPVNKQPLGTGTRVDFDILAAYFDGNANVGADWRYKMIIAEAGTTQVPCWGEMPYINTQVTD